MILPDVNMVLVRPLGTPAYSADAGIVVAEFVEEHLLQPCVGIVEGVPGGRYYGGDELLALGKYPAGHHLERARHIQEHSLMFDVPFEIQAGDVVVFRYQTSDDAANRLDDGRLLLRYDDLIARVDTLPHGHRGIPFTAAWWWPKDVSLQEWEVRETSGTSFLPAAGSRPAFYPLNGAVLVTMHQYAQGAGLLGPQVRREGWGRVVAEGARVKGYVMWPEKGGDFDVPLLNKTICFKTGAAVRIEHDAFNVLGLSGDAQLYYLHRFAINFYLEDG